MKSLNAVFENSAFDIDNTEELSKINRKKLINTEILPGVKVIKVEKNYVTTSGVMRILSQHDIAVLSNVAENGYIYSTGDIEVNSSKENLNFFGLTLKANHIHVHGAHKISNLNIKEGYTVYVFSKKLSGVTIESTKVNFGNEVIPPLDYLKANEAIIGEVKDIYWRSHINVKNIFSKYDVKKVWIDGEWVEL